MVVTRRRNIQSAPIELEEHEIPAAASTRDDEGNWLMEVNLTEAALGPTMDGQYRKQTVVVTAFVTNVLAVDLIAQTFTARIQVTLDWVDDGILKKSAGSDATWKGGYEVDERFLDNEGHATAKTIWTPQFSMVNAVDGHEPLESDLNVQVLRGRPVVVQYFDLQPTLSCDLTVRNFPFDAQTLEAVFTSHYWSTLELKFVVSKSATSGGESVVGPSVANNAEWIFGGLNIDTLTHYYPYMERYDDNNPNYPHVKIQVQVRRNPWYFVIRVCVVSVLVTLMETVSFFVAPSDLSARFSISGTTFLSAIAF